MPPLALIPNSAQLAVKYSHGGQDAITVLSGRWSTRPEFDLVLGSGWLADWWNAIRGSITSDVTCLGATLRDTSVPFGTVVEVPAPNLPQGLVTTGGTVMAASFLVKWRTATGSRRGKGRAFVPGVPAAAVAPGGRTLTSAAITGLQGNLETYRTQRAGSASGTVAAVMSRADLVVRPITTASVGSIIGIQRRRMRG